MRQRYYYADGREEKSFIGFDKRVDLAPRIHAAPAFAEDLAGLASIAPSYESSSAIATLLLGDGPCARTIWKLAQKEGERLRRQDTEERRSVFRDGELPGFDAPAKEFVGVEADSTMIHAWRRRAENHNGVSRDRLRRQAGGPALLRFGRLFRAGEKVGRKRRRLRNKVAACGLQGAKQFGQDLFTAVPVGQSDCPADAGAGVGAPTRAECRYGIALPHSRRKWHLLPASQAKPWPARRDGSCRGAEEPQRR